MFLKSAAFKSFLFLGCIPLFFACDQLGWFPNAPAESSSQAPVSTRTVVGAAGADIQLNRFKITIPKGAVDYRFEVAAQTVAADQVPQIPAQGIAGEAVELLPHGQLFEEPVTIRLPIPEGIDPTTLIPARLADDHDLDWEPLYSFSIHDEYFEITTTTFSYYALLNAGGEQCYSDPYAGLSSACTSCELPSLACTQTRGCTPFSDLDLCENTNIVAVHNGAPADEAAVDAIAATLSQTCENSLSLTVSDQNDTTFFDECTGAPTLSANTTLLIAGGSFFHRSVRHLEKRETPVFISEEDEGVAYRTRDGRQILSFEPAYLQQAESKRDYLIVQNFKTPGDTNVVHLYGFTEYGTEAAAWWAQQTFLSQPESRSFNRYIVLAFEDQGPDGPSSLSEFTVVEADVFSSTPPAEGRPVWKNMATGSVRRGIRYQYALGYVFSPKTDGHVTALGGAFAGSKTVKLFDESGIEMAQAQVKSNNAFKYRDIDSVWVEAGKVYRVVAYLAGQGGVYRYGTRAFPLSDGQVDVLGYTYTSTYNNPDRVPTNLGTSRRMYGEADIKFAPAE